MLRSLNIQNFVLIEHLELTPSSGSSVITGETGAGKSMLLGALELVLGERADTKSLLDQKRKCVIEAEFDTPAEIFKSFFIENDLDREAISILRREILPNGKSRAFINDTPVNLNTLKNLGEDLIDIHSQHDALKVNQEDFQIGILDLLAGQQKTLNLYKEKRRGLKVAINSLRSLQDKKEEQLADADYRNFLLEELDKANLNPQVDESLEQELKAAENAEEISRTYGEVSQIMDGEGYSLLNLMAQIQRNLDNISPYDTNAKEYSERFRAVFLELQDLFREIDGKSDLSDFDPERLHVLRNRMDAIQNLLNKHKLKSIQDLMDLETELRMAQSEMEQYDEQMSIFKDQIASLEIECLSLADSLSNARKKQATWLESKVTSLLGRLGMPYGTLQVEFKTQDLSEFGIDQVTFLFSANKGQKPKPIKGTASGGELSRLMLALKYLIADKSQLPTIIFDEIDTGVGGEIAIQMGQMLSAIADSHQIITITHLPQVASQGKTHYRVWKDEEGEHSLTKISLLSKEDRIQEIAEMIGGKNKSEHALTSAKELLKIN